MSWIGLAMAAVLGTGGQARAPDVRPVDVMVVGTYHFANPGLDINNPKVDDVLKPDRQRQIDAVVDALAAFRPTRIMVERVIKSPDLIDSSYAAFKPADLGSKRDERVQLAYRLAARLGHRVVYGIDEQPEDGEPDYFPFGKLAEWAAANDAQPRMDALMKEGAAMSAFTEDAQRTNTIGGALALINAPGRTAADHSVYYKLLAIGDTNAQPGADLNAMWYLRNAKIFAKLMTLASPGDRVLVIYGSGHNYWLRHFADTTAGYRNVDPVPYLQKAR